MADRIFQPSRAEVWLADLNHIEVQADGTEHYTRFREHGGKRPCVILSNNRFNRGFSGLVVVVPITKEFKNNVYHLPIEPPQGGLRVRSFAICEGVRSIARQFLIQKWGQVEDSTIQAIEEKLSLLLLSQ